MSKEQRIAELKAQKKMHQEAIALIDKELKALTDAAKEPEEAPNIQSHLDAYIELRKEAPQMEVQEAESKATNLLNSLKTTELKHLAKAIPMTLPSNMSKKDMVKNLALPIVQRAADSKRFKYMP
jgi:hypothetical protein